MIRRVFWFAMGAGSAAYVAVKVRDLVQQATPKAISQRVTGSVVEVGGSVRGFTERLRAAMAEREAELRAELDRHSDTLGRPE
jgi:NADH:ubiquinone oxidoreductase subunit D